MRLDNSRITALLNEIGDILEIQGANPFRIRSYRKAAEIIAGLSRSVEDIAGDEGLQSIAGIGKDLSGKITEMIETGSCAKLDELRIEIPQSVVELLNIQGVGPKAVKLFMDRLGVRTIDDLEQAAREGKIKDLPRMGAKLEQKIMKGIQAYVRFQGRYHLGTAYEQARRMLTYIKSVPGDLVISASIAGSLRRWRETIGDIDLLVASNDPQSVMDWLQDFMEIEEVILRGPTKMSVRTIRGIQADMRVVEPECFGSALHYFTGSKQHNIQIRERAQKMGLKVNEYGVFKEPGDVRAGGASEEEVFDLLGLPWIPPEIREAGGEFVTAEHGRMPDLVETGDIRGDLHVHSNRSDGVEDMKTLAVAARNRGYEYLAITDHTKSTWIANGQDESAILEQVEEIKLLNGELEGTGIKVLSGAEVDILPDGSLDIDDSVLKRLDLVIGSIHSRFSMPEEEMTERIINALSNPYLHVLGHPTGRLILKREPYAVDMEAVIEAAARFGKAMEINSHWERLDLKDVHARRAVELGVKLMIATDTHSADGFNNIIFGVGTARRGWVGPSDVINTYSYNELKVWLKSVRSL